MERHYDLVVVGTGVTSAVATRCREAGWSVAVIDSRPFGGTCALRGCVPKKILVSAAEAVHATRDMGQIGVSASTTAIDWPGLMTFKRSLVDPTPARTEESWAKLGVEQFLNLDRLPSRVVFVGGGYVAFEFAHVAAHAGARVTVVHRGARPLEAFDPDLVALLVKRSRELGIALEVGAEVAAIDAAPDGLVVRARQAGVERRFETDMAVHSAGRVPELDDLDLAAAGVQREKRGVSVNEFLQSVTNPAVYAGGDAAASGPPLTPKASHDAEVLTTNLLEGNRRRVNYEGIASAVFSLPPLASAGLTEEAARARNLRFRTTWQDTSGWFNTRRVGETTSGFKVLVAEDTDRVLGAHLLGPHADEVINIFAVAIRLGIPAAELKDVLFAYPTYGSDVRFML